MYCGLVIRHSVYSEINACAMYSLYDFMFAVKHSYDVFVTREFVYSLINTNTPCPKKIVPFFYLFIFFLGAQCVESGVSCTDCY